MCVCVRREYAVLRIGPLCKCSFLEAAESLHSGGHKCELLAFDIPSAAGAPVRREVEATRTICTFRGVGCSTIEQWIGSINSRPLTFHRGLYAFRNQYGP